MPWDLPVVALLAAGLLVAAFVYATVGHGGASAYLAVMALAGVAPQEMRPIALLLNVVVSSIATFKFQRAGHFRWRLFWPFAIVSIPMAFVGGAITLPGQAYKVLVAVVLLYAGWQLWLSARAGDEIRPLRDPPLAWALGIGAVMFVGAFLGRRILDRISDRAFVGALEVLVAGLGVWFLVYPPR